MKGKDLMKNLIFINGTMGVGKTTVSKELLKLLPKCVFLDGDWCWNADPFIVNDETKNMVENNISHLLNSFLSCSEYENVIFCWVMHEEKIINKMLSLIQDCDYNLHLFSITCSENALIERLKKDIDNKVREKSIINQALSRLSNYLNMNTTKIDVSDVKPDKAADIMYKHIYGGG